MSKIQHFEQLVSMTHGIPADSIDLGDWVAPCGTKACIIGYASAHPYFVHNGLGRQDKDCSYSPTFERFNHLDAIKMFFGINYDQCRYMFFPEAYPKELMGQALKDEIIERLTTHINALKLIESVQKGGHDVKP